MSRSIFLSFTVLTLMVSLTLTSIHNYNADDETFQQHKFSLTTKEIDRDYVTLFKEFIVKYNKTHIYSNSKSYHYNSRLAIFRDNLIKIKMYQEADSLASYGITKFSDLTEAEFESQYLNLRDVPKSTLAGTDFEKVDEVETISKNYNLEFLSDLPDNFDWRQKGVVSEIKEQGTCGSCWAFASTQAIESHHAIKNGKLVILSEQQLVDCDTQGFGCNGGYHFEAFDYVKRQGGILSEEDYPYVHRHNKTCKYDETKVVTKVSGYVNVTSDENEILKALVENGPIAVGLDGRHWQFYRGGISNPWLCTNAMNHAVLIVGYGIEKKTPYWIIKNSWGTKWGEKGYVRLIRGKNKCGVHRSPSYPIIE